MDNFKEVFNKIKSCKKPERNEIGLSMTRAIGNGSDFEYKRGTINLVILMEELSELIKAISKFIRGKEDSEYDILEELADVYIYSESLFRLAGITYEDFDIAVRVKLDAMKEKLDNEDRERQSNSN